MTKETLKNLTHAHAWLGIIFSGVLMIVFVCGSISFFRAQVLHWDSYYNPIKTLPDEVAPLSKVLSYLEKQNYSIPSDHNVYVDWPDDDTPFFTLYFATELPKAHDHVKEGDNHHAQPDHEDHQLFFDAKTGEKLAINEGSYYLSQLLFRLHYDLGLPFGRELVGVISLLFFVLLISGVCIHLKKLVSHFYQHRTHKRKDNYLDSHNLIGVSTLPYTIMYALTGVMLNIAILFQGGFGLTAYHGEMEKMAGAFGFTIPQQILPKEQPIDVAHVDKVTEDIARRFPSYDINSFQIDRFGDISSYANIELSGPHALAQRVILTYQLVPFEIVNEVKTEDSAAGTTIEGLTSLHFGHFGGITITFVYFILGLGCCYLILTGNLIWLEKRASNRNQNQRGFAFAKALTLTLSVGTLSAVAASFVATRFVPAEFARTDFLMATFYVAYFTAFVHAWGLKTTRQTMVQQLRFAALLFAACPIYDAILLLFVMPHVDSHLSVVWMVNLVLTLMAVFCFSVAQHYRHKQKPTAVTQ
jgi:uncharacterized iron-regulated membrane protein